MEGKLRMSLAFFVLLSVASQLKASTCYLSAQRLDANPYGSNFSLSSPNYPFNYYNNQDCSWYIAAPYSSMLIKLTFYDFYLQSSTSCTRDYIEIRDGRYSSSTFLSRYCGSKRPPTIISKGRYLYIKFHSNYMSTYRGFKLTYTAVSPVTNAKGKCSSLYSFEANNNIQMTSEQGTIKSPNYPIFNYPNNIQCTWKITVPRGKTIKLTIDYMSMESSLFCTADYLQVRDGYYSTSTKKGDYCGSTRLTITSSSRYLWVRFRSDHQYTAKGFSLSYSTREESSSTVGTIIGVLSFA
ncbi:CUB domain-containing protein 2-like [Actinia tenebrosa]|uniref:CUB domain-containing protein 2-like n=1 Tax=Actinia tenebrosa TaxID=6105 RepID=A0A6P8H9E4_ACTTE|nr:CUB domain-containing protein 2-like [Actinia tenebrosa]